MLSKTIALLLLLAVSVTASTAEPNNESPEPGPRQFTLPQALQYALENSPALRQEVQRIAREEGVLIEAKALFLPRVDLVGNYEQTDSGLLPSFGGTTFGSDNDWRVAVEVSQTLYAGGRNLARREGQTLRVEAIKENYQAAVEEVILGVRAQFYLVLLAEAEVVVQEENVRLLETELRDTQRRYDAGSLPEFNLLRAKVALANGQVPLIRTRNQLRLSLDELARLMGYRPPVEFDDEPPLKVEGELGYEEGVPSLQAMLAFARANRPELKGVALSIDASQEEVKVAERHHLPELSAYAGYALIRDPFTSSTRDYNNGWFVGVRGQWNLFDGFASRGRTQAARSDVRRLQAEEDSIYLQIDMEVRRALSELREAAELVDASQQVVGQAEESVRLAQSRYNSGVGTQLELLDSQVALTQARSNKVRALFDYNLARARLDRAIGSSDVVTWRNF